MLMQLLFLKIQEAKVTLVQMDGLRQFSLIWVETKNNKFFMKFKYLKIKGCILINESTHVTKMSWEESYQYCYNLNARLLEVYTEDQFLYLTMVLGISFNLFCYEYHVC